MNNLDRSWIMLFLVGNSLSGEVAAGFMIFGFVFIALAALDQVKPK